MPSDGDAYEKWGVLAQLDQYWSRLPYERRHEVLQDLQSSEATDELPRFIAFIDKATNETYREIESIAGDDAFEGIGSLSTFEITLDAR